MIGKLIAKAGMAILPAILRALLRIVPVERVAAWSLNWMLGKVDGHNIDRARKTAEHLAELSQVFADALADHHLTEEEIHGACGRYAIARRALIDEWARGKSAKPLERVLNGADILAARPAADRLAPDVQLLQTK